MEKGGSGFFDLATRTGWAYGHPGVLPSCGVFDLKGSAEDGTLYAALYECVCDFIEWHKPTRLYAEAPLSPQGTKSNMNAWLILIGMVGVVRCVGAQYGLRVRLMNLSKIRSDVLSGLPWNQKQKNGKKPVVEQWCADQGIFTPDHNAADAVVGLEHSLRLFSRKGFARDLAQP